MAIDPTRFCINRKIAPNLSLEAFFQLVQRLGLNKVELRNDMPSGKVCDDLTAEQTRELIAKYNIEVVTINALYPFNRVDEALLAKADALLRDAQAIGARALVMCPLNEGVEIAPEETLAALRTLAPRFAQHGVQGLVEPLGFPVSSLRSAVQAQQLIRDAQVPFKLVIDTFHHHLYEHAEQEFPAEIDVDMIGLVHLSGVEDRRATAELTDEERIMLSDQDVLNSVAQVKRLEMLGYKGVYAFEPFSSELNSWTPAEIERQIRHSIALLQA
ncbi:TIM barrel protein [Pantoea sp. ACRSH]|uniref:TIM barrel protein n=1 Tax=unclassified Pantoea TaxID=2630326 RepID=UPI001EF4D6A9|nr:MULTISPECIES: TIM barrel protein [unclassified Pantoea]MCG7366668.1 TIM barrel protein [Pantoea sp. ACRSH]MCG7395941.1 TIM barrel protein [Pantoea sp. ACRSC]